MKKIILVSGDPNSINSEIIFKVWRKLNVNIKKRLYLIGNYSLILSQFKKLKFKTNLEKVKNIEQNNNLKLKIIDIPLKFKDPFNVPLKDSSRYVLQSLSMAHNICEKNKINSFINCPIDKKLLHVKKIIGVTEFLAKKNKIKDNSEVMMIYNEKVAVVPITTHIKLKKVSSSISRSLLSKKLITLNNCYRKIFKIKPKICLLGLNPHNGELAKNSEEIKILVPEIKRLKNKKLNIQGPLVADTVFIKKFKNFNVIVGMYHDQVLTPFKTLYGFNAINITLGLKYIRVSPDHGTAVDLINKNKADCSSLYKCISFINKMS